MPLAAIRPPDMPQGRQPGAECRARAGWPDGESGLTAETCRSGTLIRATGRREDGRKVVNIDRAQVTFFLGVGQRPAGPARIRRKGRRIGRGPLRSLAEGQASVPDRSLLRRGVMRACGAGEGRAFGTAPDICAVRMRLLDIQASRDLRRARGLARLNSDAMTGWRKSAPACCLP